MEASRHKCRQAALVTTYVSELYAISHSLNPVDIRAAPNPRQISAKEANSSATAPAMQQGGGSTPNGGSAANGARPATPTADAKTTGAHVLVANLIAQGVRRVFCIPGAKIDRIVEVLRETPEIELVLCRNEMTAGFMAAGHGRRTGRAGVVLVTSGPGVTNLVTAAATANCEGDPLVLLGGNASMAQRYKATHQGLDNVAILKPVTKFAAEVPAGQCIAEVVANAFRAAEMVGRPGAAFVSLPQDVMVGPAKLRVLGRSLHAGGANPDDVAAAAAIINGAKSPVLLLGMFASAPDAAAELRRLLATHAMPAVTTFQGIGVVPQELNDLFGGRVGLIRNTTTDRLLDEADVVVAVGYDPVEYDVDLWNADGRNRSIIHIDTTAATLDNCYVPHIELTGSIGSSIAQLVPLLERRALTDVVMRKELRDAKADVTAAVKAHANDNRMPVHPLRLVSDLQSLFDEAGGERLKLFLDMGSHHIWNARFLHVHQPRQMVISNGQQTMGVSLPWAMSAALDARDPGSTVHHAWSEPPAARAVSLTGGFDSGERFISLSGDGSFLFCAQELETAVRLGLNLTHIVWVDGTLNMVKIQQEKKYGSSCCVELGSLDYVKFAESFGAVGFHVTSADEFLPILKRSFSIPLPVVISVEVDYSQNGELFKDVIDPERFH
ncbi:MAG: thiamine pyrophosphate enzyme, N-terminal TPP binding domain-containing protein, partial [Monoraphidium minutum]